MSISQMIEEEREIVSFAEGDSRFLQQCFQVFFGALLGVKAGCIVIGSLSGAELAVGCGQIAFCLLDPLSGEGLHTAFFLWS
jgi:hypothetical protein